MTAWKHDDLATDLAAHLRGYARPAMIWTDLQLGPAGSPRPDVYSLEPTYQAIRAVAYECKISRADFQSDVTSGKALRYLEFAGALVFATPKGLVRKDEVPGGCGLIERSETGWRWAKKPSIGKVTSLAWTVWMKLLLDGIGREENGQSSVVIVRRCPEHLEKERLARRVLGEELATILRDRDHAKSMLQYETEQLERDRKEVAEARRQLHKQRYTIDEAEQSRWQATLDAEAALLGLPPGTHLNTVIRELHDRRPANDQRRLEQAAGHVRRAILSLTETQQDLDQLLQLPKETLA